MVKVLDIRRKRYDHISSIFSKFSFYYLHFQEIIPTRPSDISWDSVSQTSSTSGYRDNYSFQTSLLSPDGSLSGAAPLARSSSQHSMLMLFEAQDEDTLI